MVLQAVKESEGVALILEDVFGEPGEVPTRIRVWRRALDDSESSCTGRVDELGLEDYVAGVIPAEWMAGWEPAALEAGAIAARTYASFWVAAGGKYACADVDDTTWTQVYRDARDERTDAAVARTEGAVVRRNGSLVFAEYSAENGSPTAFGVHDTPCAGKRVNGHGRGVCQWGTQRWALRGETPDWMMAHYYPGSRVVWPDEALTEGVDLLVRSGDRFELSLTAVNIAPEPWPAGSVGVGTEPSAFADEGWVSPTRPSIHEAPVSQHASATVRWWMTAPHVDSPTTYPEFFYLDGPASERPGAAGSWRITVIPGPPRGGSRPSEGNPWAMLAASAAGLLLLGGLLLWSRRRIHE